MKSKLVESILIPVAAFSFFMLVSCKSTAPNNAIFNSRGGHIPPPKSASNSFELSTPAVAKNNSPAPFTIQTRPDPVDIDDGSGIGIIIEDTPSGIIIEDVVEPPTGNTPLETVSIEKMTYKVQKNDSLWKVAENYGVSVQDLATENNLPPKAQLKIGQVLTLPSGARLGAKPSSVNPPESATTNLANSQKYTVKKGDSLSIIAYKYKTSTSALKSTNTLDSDVIKVGQQLIIPNKNKPRSTNTMTSGNKPPPGFSSTGNTYTIKKGDSLSAIAYKHKTTVSKLKQANGLESDDIIVGNKLIIPESKTVELPKVSKKQNDIKEELFAQEPDVEKKETVKPAEKKTPPASYTTVIVFSDDTLESLADDLNSTVQLIKEANPGINGNEDLQAGQTIKVPQNN